jgi:LPXTG-site transpeptidase (sortase) family protein
MRTALRLLGNFLITAATVGLVLLLARDAALWSREPGQAPQARAVATATPREPMPTPAALMSSALPTSADGGSAVRTPDAAPAPRGMWRDDPPRIPGMPTAAPTPSLLPEPSAIPTPEPERPITRVEIPRIPLVADVVTAPLVENGDDVTWYVPAFKAGHAEGTAGAGQVGNAVLLGHVTSRNAGNVFQTLQKARVGDVVVVDSDDDAFEYRVTSIRSVPRDDVDVLEPQGGTSVTLITCTGAWNAALWDYMERLVVRADLVEPPLDAVDEFR